MLVTEPGIVIDVNPEQPEYVDVAGYQLFVADTIEKWSGFSLET